MHSKHLPYIPIFFISNTNIRMPTAAVNTGFTCCESCHEMTKMVMVSGQS